MLLLDERIRADGSHATCWIDVVGDDVQLTDDDGPIGALSVTAIERVMLRYGKPLDAAITAAGEALALPGGFALRRLRYHAIVDAEARDYLVWERPDAEPLCVVATMATAALRHLAAAARAGASRPQESEA